MTMRNAACTSERSVRTAVAGEIVAMKMSVTRVRLSRSTRRSSKSVRVRVANFERRFTAICLSAHRKTVATTMEAAASSHRSTGFPSH